MICGALATQPGVPPRTGEQDWHPAAPAGRGDRPFVAKKGKLWPYRMDMESARHDTLFALFIIFWLGCSGIAAPCQIPTFPQTSPYPLSTL